MGIYVVLELHGMGIKFRIQNKAADIYEHSIILVTFLESYGVPLDFRFYVHIIRHTPTSTTYSTRQNPVWQNPVWVLYDLQIAQLLLSLSLKWNIILSRR